MTDTTTPAKTPEAGPSAEQVTLSTIRQHVERMLEVTAVSGVQRDPRSHAAGYDHACREILAILDMNGRPAHEPVIFRAPDDPGLTR